MKFSQVAIVILLPLILLQSRLEAQEVLPTYSDYLTDNLYLLHPSMAGASNLNKLRLTARQQWFEVKDAPSLQTLSVHGRLNQKVGVGGIIFNDQNGNYARRGIYGSFAYHLMFSRSELDLNQLSFGVSAGLIQHILDERRFLGNDPLIGNGNNSDIYTNMDVGASYYYFNFFAHLTAKNLLSINRELFFSEAIPNNQRKYLFSTGYVIETRSRYWSYEPSILFQLKEATSEKTVDLNFKIYRDLSLGSLFGGLSYRRSFDASEYTSNGENLKNDQLQYLTPFVGFEYKRFLFAYTYSQQFNSHVISNSGFHQLTLGYNFGKNRARYDCYCPGVNQRKSF
ncbi:PorP/SprF family type IX secretion system membrane protein [Salinimicrobium catena]|uniref:PorP/SprF family type IX secretion system membrane protein n=1 Tax=Salinimicrobium catena TaxID=390640 RepID=UPI000B821E37|nr:type IX secretion system membrane protein PorP/SprF [Salinimicrobium catena]